MRRHILGLSLFIATLLAAAGAVQAQTVSPGGPDAMVCAYNVTTPTLATGQLGFVQCGPDGRLQFVEAGTSSTAGGILPQVSGSASATLTIKSTPGNLYGAYATCTAACWLMIFNSTTAPADGATTAGNASGNLQDCIPIASGGTGGVTYRPGPGEIFTVGITAVISSTACATKTAATTGFIHGDAR